MEITLITGAFEFRILIDAVMVCTVVAMLGLAYIACKYVEMSNLFDKAKEEVKNAHLQDMR
jgi:hypothetical protein